MGIRQQWRATRKVMAQEKDERSELANLRVSRDVLAAIVATVVVVSLALLAAPLSDQARAAGLPLLLVGMMAAGGIAYRVSRHRNRPYSREYERAESFQTLVLWLPLSMLTAAAAVALFAIRQAEAPWSPALVPTAVGLALGVVVSIGLEYRRYRRLAR